MAETEATTEVQTEQTTTETTEQIEEQKPVAEQEQSEETKQEETKPDEVKPEEESEEEEEVEYVCPEEFDEREEMCKMFVGGLDKETTDDEFKELFTSFGEIKDFIIIRKENSKSERLFGFITFTKCDDLEACLLARPHTYKEKELDVKRAVPKTNNENTGHIRAKKLHIANIPAEFSVKTLKKYIKSRHPAKFGTIEDINFLKTKNPEGTEGKEKNRGFGFINVSTEDFADRVAIAESKFTLEGNNLRITKARPKTQGQGGGNRGRGQWNNQGGYGNYGGYNNFGPGYFNNPYGGGYGGGFGNGGYGGGGYGNYNNFGGQQGGGRGGGGRYKPY